MVYKYLLDGLLSPNFRWNLLFESQKLNSGLAFSDAFLAQMMSLSETNQLGELVSDCRNLQDLTVAWLDGVRALEIPSGRSDHRLEVVFRTPVDYRGQ